MIVPKVPIYIVSKGRWATSLTSRALSEIGVKHHVVVEESERARYEAALSGSCASVIVLDPRYQREYDTFDDLGDSKSRGPGAARNFAWETSIAEGASWHWVMDDNINGFYRLTRNLKVPVRTHAILRAMEDFCDRYENVAMGGPNYFMFASRKSVMPPFVANTRIYSCNLIRNSAPYRWRGRYNEDTDLSLRMLKDGWCTVQFNAFLQMKTTTQVLGGGCTEAFYSREGTRPKSEMLARMHPDVAKVIWRWGRWHHVVDYSPFRGNRLLRRPGLVLPPGDDEYGMELVEGVQGTASLLGAARRAAGPAPAPAASDVRAVAKQQPAEAPRAVVGPTRPSSPAVPVVGTDRKAQEWLGFSKGID